MLCIETDLRDTAYEDKWKEADNNKGILPHSQPGLCQFASYSERFTRGFLSLE